MAIELNEKQRAGLELAIKRYNQGYPYTCIAGYAANENIFGQIWRNSLK